MRTAATQPRTPKWPSAAPSRAPNSNYELGHRMLSPRHTLVFLVSLMAAACTVRQEAPKHGESARQAPADVKESFRVGPPSPEPAKPEGPKSEAPPAEPKKAAADRVIRLKKASLGKAFLLFPSMRDAAPAAQWSDYAPAVVVFEKSGSS